MRLVTYNIQYTKGQDGRFDVARIAEAVQAGDIIGLQEVDRYWQRTGSEDQAVALAERFPGYAWVYGAGYDAPARPSLGANSSAEERGRRRQHGNMILSRWPILSSRVLPLPKAKPQEFCQLRVMLEAVIAAPGAPLRVYSHLGGEPPTPGRADADLFPDPAPRRSNLVGRPSERPVLGRRRHAATLS